MFNIKENSSTYRNECFGVEQGRNSATQAVAIVKARAGALGPAPALAIAIDLLERSAFVGCKS
jgi:hypothetical protein